jgi:hypothetical protein
VWDPRSSVTPSPSVVAPVSVRCALPRFTPRCSRLRHALPKIRSALLSRPRISKMSGAAAEAFPCADLGASAWVLLRLGPGRAHRWRPARAAGASLLLWLVPISSLSSVLSVAVCFACPYRHVMLFTGFQNPINPRLAVPLSVLRLRNSVGSLCPVLPPQRPCRCFLPISYMKPLYCVVFLFP